ncbi:hydantoinase/oxoprolinase family protein [Achromobacter aloeverae]|uniref:5-oxoprolinase n=1 Tax=Achromobacter aloeverae TaxID=1750518 RepID=A0A4Q1HDU1_9BURK|nr:hydantoinase/oxoprolinase family protein [Achromobacter aloeverae]RXN83381.1 5-oxoprolinase [Achromobacter aloeverae]
MVRIGIDVGGTFTDFVMADGRTGKLSYFKVPSSPEDPSVAIAQGTREMLARFSVMPGDVEYFGHGTTVATNMVIERRGVKTGLVTTRGFRDVLAIGRQTRPSLYDHGVDKPAPLVRRRHRLEVGERLDAAGQPLRALDESELEQRVRELVADGVESIAIAFLHSYRNSDHEAQARRVVERIAPGLHVSISCEVLPEFREFERTSTTVLNAYVAPRMHHYLERLRTRLEGIGLTVQPLTFHSNGGLMPLKTVARLPVLSCLSGPAAGVVGSTLIGVEAGLTEIITFDVGGTSTDVSLITGGRPGCTSDRLVAGYPVKMPMIDIHVVGAGGGSIARLDDVGALKVGPESAGAIPGPVAFGKGGRLPTLTDANIVLGRLNPRALLDGRMEVDREAAAAVIDELIARPIGVSVAEAAHGILRIATANMSRAIRTVSTEHGHDPADFTLFAFGGAGPLHAAEVARECGIGEVLVPHEPGTMCARGILLADVTRDFVRTQLAPLNEESWERLQAVLDKMRQEGDAWLEQERVPQAQRQFHFHVDSRYRGQTHDIRVALQPGGDRTLAGFVDAFHRAHKAQHGHDHPGRPIEIVNCRLQAVGLVAKGGATAWTPAGTAPVWHERDVYFGQEAGWTSTRVYHRESLGCGVELAGPVIIEEMSSTTVVLPGQLAAIDRAGNIRIRI